MDNLEKQLLIDKYVEGMERLKYGPNLESNRYDAIQAMTGVLNEAGFGKISRVYGEIEAMYFKQQQRVVFDRQELIAKYTKMMIDQIREHAGTDEHVEWNERNVIYKLVSELGYGELFSIAHMVKKNFREGVV